MCYYVGVSKRTRKLHVVHLTLHGGSVNWKMATSNVNIPDKLNFSKPEEWPRWIKRFERYLSVAGITSDDQKVNTLIYAMGPQAEDVMLMFGLAADAAKKYDVVRAKFESHFIVRRNVIYERARFNSRVQKDGESIEKFQT